MIASRSATARRPEWRLRASFVECWPSPGTGAISAACSNAASSPRLPSGSKCESSTGAVKAGDSFRFTVDKSLADVKYSHRLGQEASILGGPRMSQDDAPLQELFGSYERGRLSRREFFKRAS